MALDRLAQEAGFELIRVRNDHLAMMEAAERRDVDFVAGTLGGFIFPGFQRGADAAYAAARLLEMLALAKVRVSELVGRIKPGHVQMTEIPCPWNRKGRVMRRLIDYTSGMKRDTVDGVRVVFDDRWVMVAPSRRQASFYLVTEAPTQESAARLLTEYQRLVIQWRDIPDGVD
jgi:mannose-1-phosphate guanylyltransferase/phosphomannomutase